MTNTIAQLWNGNLVPVNSLGRSNPAIRQLENLMYRNIEKLEESLNEKEKGILEKYIDCVGEYTLATCEQAFCDGFCFGAKITAEALLGIEQLI